MLNYLAKHAKAIYGIKIYFQSIIFHTRFVFLQIWSESFGNFQLSISFYCPRLIVKTCVLILVRYALWSWECCQTVIEKEIGWKESNKGERSLEPLSKCTMPDISSQFSH